MKINEADILPIGLHDKIMRTVNLYVFKKRLLCAFILLLVNIVWQAFNFTEVAMGNEAGSVLGWFWHDLSFSAAQLQFYWVLASTVLPVDTLLILFAELLFAALVGKMILATSKKLKHSEPGFSV